MRSSKFNMEVTAGETVIKLLKDYFFADEKWTPNLAWKIGTMLGEIKSKAKLFFQNQEMIEVLGYLAKFSKEDFEEMMQINNQEEK